MGKILGTWLVKLTLRAPDEADEATDDFLEKAAAAVPTNEKLGELLADALVDEIIEDGGPALLANATLVERTDD